MPQLMAGRARKPRAITGLLARYVRPELGQVKLSRIKPLDFQSLLVGLSDGGLSARTVRYIHAVYAAHSTRSGAGN